MKTTLPFFASVQTLRFLAAGMIAAYGLTACAGYKKGVPPPEPGTLPGHPATCSPAKEKAAFNRIMRSPLPDNLVQASYQNDSVAPTRLDCYAKDGKAIFEGDIEIATLDTTGKKGTVIKGQGYRWVNATVPYVISCSDPGRVKKAIKLLEDTRIVKFVPHADGVREDYVRFVDGKDPNVGFSAVGRQGHGEQQITLGANCRYGVAMHEICHALGLWHEQSRADRDNYVCIMWDNIIPAMRMNFNQHIRDGVDTAYYDYDSIMHYFDTAFSKDGHLPTIVAKQANVSFGQQDHLSKGDIETLKSIYPR